MARPHMIVTANNQVLFMLSPLGDAPRVRDPRNLLPMCVAGHHSAGDESGLRYAEAISEVVAVWTRLSARSVRRYRTRRPARHDMTSPQRRNTDRCSLTDEGL